jgi:osmotically-inducible protein OsmY
LRADGRLTVVIGAEPQEQLVLIFLVPSQIENRLAAKQQDGAGRVKPHGRLSVVAVALKQGEIQMNHKHGLSIKIALVATMSVLAQGVAGAVQVRSHVQVTAHANGERMRRADAAIKADVEKTLRADPSLVDSWIVVKSVRNGVVRLSGNAASSTDNVRALQLTAARRGVRKVFSEIYAYDAVAAVSGAIPVSVPVEAGSLVRREPVGPQDDAIRRGVEAALDDLDARENADIRVRVTDGVVWLSGSVPAWQGNSSRLDAARSVTGVRSIINELRVAGLYVSRL